MKLTLRALNRKGPRPSIQKYLLIYLKIYLNALVLYSATITKRDTFNLLIILLKRENHELYSVVSLTLHKSDDM